MPIGFAETSGSTGKVPRELGERIPVESRGPIEEDQGDVEEFARPVKGLVYRKGDPALRLGVVDQ